MDLNKDVNLAIFMVLIVVATGLIFFRIGVTSANNKSEVPEDKMTMVDTMHNKMDAHGDHAELDVDDWENIPAVSMDLVEDAKSGYNLKLTLINFEFTPDNVNGDNVENQGHAHLFINGEKINRLYAENYHISGDLLKEGENKVMVTLNANDHSELLFEGDHVQVMGMVEG